MWMRSNHSLSNVYEEEITLKLYRLRRLMIVVLLCLSTGWVLAQDATPESTVTPECAEGDGAACTEGYMLTADEGEAIWFGDGLVTIKASADMTGGVMAAMEFISLPGPGPLHLHHLETEAFYILEGEMRVVVGEKSWNAKPGSFVWLPRGIQHGYAVGDVPLKMLVIALPAGFENFVREAGEPAKERTLPPLGLMDMDKVMAASTNHQIDMLGLVEMEP
jgi:quercetin dioxygenase-like cupin family protein